MKFLLTVIMCSQVAGSCLTPHTFPDSYDTPYDCLMDGYVKSIEKFEEIGRQEVNRHFIYIKFDCQAVIIPEKKPIPAPSGQPTSLQVRTILPYAWGL